MVTLVISSKLYIIINWHIFCVYVYTICYLVCNLETSKCMHKHWCWMLLAKWIKSNRHNLYTLIWTSLMFNNSSGESAESAHNQRVSTEVWHLRWQTVVACDWSVVKQLEKYVWFCNSQLAAPLFSVGQVVADSDEAAHRFYLQTSQHGWYKTVTATINHHVSKSKQEKQSNM